MDGITRNDLVSLDRILRQNSNNKPVEKMITNEKEESDIEEMDHESEDSEQSGSASGDSFDGSESDEASGKCCLNCIG